jgi:hypothetical protein
MGLNRHHIEMLAREHLYRPIRGDVLMNHQVAGTEQAFKYGYDKDHRPILTREPKLVLDNLEAGKIENFWLAVRRQSDEKQSNDRN